jgi:uncharacterized protein (DUF362 family)
MNKEKVAVVEVGQDIHEDVGKGMALIGGLNIRQGARVVVKPNICNSKNPYGMVLTDFRLIEAVVRLVQKTTKRITVVESDNISGKAEKRMSESGLLGKLEGMGVEFVNLSGDDSEPHQIDGIEIKLPKTVLQADFFINLPKIKTEGHTLVTLSIKNLFGVLQRANKKELHKHLDVILPYLAKVIRNDLIVADGMTAMEGNGPLIGSPRDVGILVFGSNPVSVDAACASIMGFDPAEIGHLVRAHEMGVGEISLDNIDLIGHSSHRSLTPFERPYSLRASIRSIRSIGKVYFSK